MRFVEECLESYFSRLYDAEHYGCHFIGNISITRLTCRSPKDYKLTYNQAQAIRLKLAQRI